VMPRPHQAASTLMECNHKIQIRFVSSPGSVIRISCAHRCWRRMRLLCSFNGCVDSTIDAMRLVAFAGA